MEVRDVMEALEPTLQHCPFCGAPAVINGIFAYSLPGAVVRCSQCKCSTEMKLSGQKFPSGKNVTLVVAAAQAVHDWNHRKSIFIHYYMLHGGRISNLPAVIVLK